MLSRDGSFAIVGWLDRIALPPERDHHWRIDVPSGAATLISTNPDGQPAQWSTKEARLSGNGRQVVFNSRIGNLVPGYEDVLDPDGQPISVVIRKDLLNGRTDIVSVSADGVLPLGSAGNASISFDGRYIAFESFSNDLVPGVAPIAPASQIFLKDTFTGDIWWANRGHSGESSQSRGSYEPSISDDGRRIVFRSYYSNLVENDQNADRPDVFLYEHGDPMVTLISLSNTGEQGLWNNGNLEILPINGTVFWHQGSPQISADGREVLFHADSGNLAPELPPLMRTPNVFARGLPSRGDPPPPPVPAQPVPGIGLAGLLLMAALILLLRHRQTDVPRRRGVR